MPDRAKAEQQTMRVETDYLPSTPISHPQF
jgi:hypothetical protein